MGTPFASEGAIFHGELSSADASAGAAFALYGAGSVSAITLNADDQVIITDLMILAGAALTITVFDGEGFVVAAGERIAKVSLSANGGIVECMTTPHYCQKGTYPNLLASGAGQIDASIRGRIVRRGV